MTGREIVVALIESVTGPRIDYSRPYRFRVVTQHDDGTLDLEPMPVREAKMPSQTNVPIAYGEPGVRAKVKRGAIVFVEFLEGDETAPHVTGWAAGAVDELTLDAATIRLGGDRPIAREGDPVTIVVDPAAMAKIKLVATTGSVPFTLSGYVLKGSRTSKSS